MGHGPRPWPLSLIARRSRPSLGEPLPTAADAAALLADRLGNLAAFKRLGRLRETLGLDDDALGERWTWTGRRYGVSPWKVVTGVPFMPEEGLEPPTRGL